MPIELIRLVTGDEIIGFAKKHSNGTVDVIHPMIVETTESPEGYQYTVLTKYLPYLKDELASFKETHILNSHEVHPEVQKFYKLSYHLSQKHDENRLDLIREANYKMEAMAKQAMEPHEEMFNQEYIHKGTDTKH